MLQPEILAMLHDTVVIIGQSATGWLSDSSQIMQLL